MTIEASGSHSANITGQQGGYYRAERPDGKTSGPYIFSDRQLCPADLSKACSPVAPEVLCASEVLRTTTKEDSRVLQLNLGLHH